jgi:sugar/nucleoside kinase (ribokinase family)
VTTPLYDTLGIGNAIVDILARCEDDLLLHKGLHKGSMQLIDEAGAQALYEAMGPTTMISGGSAANTIVGISSFGGKSAFIGKVRDDAHGKAFAHDIRAAGVTFTTPKAKEGRATAQCLIFITPDGERTMNTYLGSCQTLSVEDIDPALVEASQVTYLEGYLWDPPEAKLAFRRAADIAHAKGRKTALTLSDSFCVDRYRDEFLALIRSGFIDILFANMHELRSLYETADLDTALGALKQENILGVVTCSDQGAVVVENNAIISVPAVSVEEVVDTTGAGDLFAAGFLFGYARDLGSQVSAKLGALAASEIISHVGARPQHSLQDLARANGLLV